MTRLIMKRQRKPAIAAERKELPYRLSTCFCVLLRSSGSGRSSRLILIFQATQRSFPSGYTLPGDGNSLIPDVSIELITVWTQKLLSQALERISDAAFVSSPVHHPGIGSQPVFRGGSCARCRNGPPADSLGAGVHSEDLVSVPATRGKRPGFAERESRLLGPTLGPIRPGFGQLFRG